MLLICRLGCIQLCHINAHITCRLCDGYLIDATTVTECLHTFCRSCLVKYLEENNTCPTCRINRWFKGLLKVAEVLFSASKLHRSTQDVPPCAARLKMVYKEEPGPAGRLYNPPPLSPPQVSICLECNSSKLRGLKRKWIRCSAQATVLHLKKFIAKKLNLTSFNEVNHSSWQRDHTLKFVVVTRWRFKVRTFSAAAVRHVKGSSVTGAPSRLLPRDRRVFSC
uniref:RING-type domain-containing protein n=1 Tax=Gasterosteus aculeatus aculeatus TaxID=481459 RepID=A0AAQ4R7K7_GASAC